ncbi:MAG: hydroxymethylbilane synthase [Planctomycetota bacterium]
MLKIRIGTRGSELALTQTRWVAERLRGAHPGIELEEVVLQTRGDLDRTTPLAEQGTVGLFTRELERALLAKEIDLAVHSLKDLPTAQPEGLAIAAVPARQVPWDAWISSEAPDLVDLPGGSKIATGSPRRRAQILARFPQLEVIGIRGNIDTRLKRYQEEGAMGLILAAAGLLRTGHEAAIRATFGPTEMTPAPAQGALALEVRSDDRRLREAAAAIEDPRARAAVTAERSLLAALEGGCQLPLGAFARVRGEHLVLLGMLADLDGKRLLRLSVEGPVAEPQGLGEDLANKLRSAGGGEILATLAAAEAKGAEE